MEQSKSKIYISKRCQHCRRLLLLLKDRPDIRGTVVIITIDDNPFPNIIKNVPAMIDTKGELWSAEELFKAITESQPQQPQQQQQQHQMHQQQMNQQQNFNPMPGQNQMLEQPQMVNQQPPITPDQQPSAAPPGDEMFDGYCDSGGCLSFSPLDDNSNIDFSGYSSLDSQTVALDVGNDGYQNKNQRTSEMDNAYNRMMEERGKIV